MDGVQVVPSHGRQGPPPAGLEAAKAIIMEERAARRASVDSRRKSVDAQRKSLDGHVKTAEEEVEDRAKGEPLACDAGSRLPSFATRVTEREQHAGHD